MKRILLYVLILAAVWVVPTNRVDIAKLRPIEVIAVYKQGNTVVLATDTEDMGIGSDALSALENMRQTSPAIIYLDTAEYLLISQNAEAEALALRDALKDSVKLCINAGEIDLKHAGKYLPVHGDLPSFRNWERGERLPVIKNENGRIKISENSEKGA